MEIYKHITCYPGMKLSPNVIEKIQLEDPMIPLPKPGSTIYERAHSFFWKGDGDFVWSVSKHKPSDVPGFDLKLETDEILRITKGQKLNVIADINGAQVQSKAESERDNIQHVRVLNSLAMITKSPLIKMAANLFLAISTPCYPARIFNQVHSATEWIKKHSEQPTIPPRDFD